MGCRTRVPNGTGVVGDRTPEYMIRLGTELPKLSIVQDPGPEWAWVVGDLTPEYMIGLGTELPSWNSIHDGRAGDTIR